ncbi:MAG: hypothetical protein WBQ89_18505 [Candidatus Acidiferrum sp.]
MIPYSTRVKMGVVLLSLVILNSTLRQSVSTLFHSQNLLQTHYISQYERRFAEVKRFLPPNQIVFYIDDFDESLDQCDAFYLTQYSLTPTVLAAFDSNCGSAEILSSHNSRLVLENFHDPQNDPYLLSLLPSNYFEAQPRNDRFKFASVHRVLLRDFGHGVRLYTVLDK